MTNLFYSNFDTVFDSMLNWDNDSRSISTPTSYIKDDVLKIELEVPGLSNKDVDVKVEDRFLLIKEKENRKLERKYKIHESFDLNSTSAVVKMDYLRLRFQSMKIEKQKHYTKVK